MKVTNVRGALIFLVAAIPLLWNGPVAAQNTGNTLVNWDLAEQRVRAGLDDPEDLIKTGQLMGFLQGVGNILDGLRIVCLPPRSTVGQWKIVVFQYLRDNPEKLDENATQLTLNALSSAFPCRRP